MKIELLEPTGELTVDLVIDALGLVSNVAYDRAALERLSALELHFAYDWAMREHLAANGNRVRRRDRPTYLDAAVYLTSDEVSVERLVMYLDGVVTESTAASLRAGAWRVVGVGDAVRSLRERLSARLGVHPSDLRPTLAVLSLDDVVAERVAAYVEYCCPHLTELTLASSSVGEAVAGIRSGLWRQCGEREAVTRLFGDVERELGRPAIAGVPS